MAEKIYPLWDENGSATQQTNEDSTLVWNDEEEALKRSGQGTSYWDDRVKNLQHRPRKGNVHVLSDNDVFKNYVAHKTSGGDMSIYKHQIETGDVKFTPYDIEREYKYRKALLDARGDKEKTAKVNEDYVKKEMEEHNRQFPTEYHGDSWHANDNTKKKKKWSIFDLADAAK